VLINGVEGLGFKDNCALDFSITLSIHPVANTYLILFRAGEGGSGAGERWLPNSHSGQNIA